VSSAGLKVHRAELTALAVIWLGIPSGSLFANVSVLREEGRCPSCAAEQEREAGEAGAGHVGGAVHQEGPVAAAGARDVDCRPTPRDQSRT
jgi:hypothetical protein